MLDFFILGTYNEVKKGGERIKIKEIRKRSKVSPKEFAAELGLSRTSYYNRLKGSQAWTLPELVILSELLKKVSEEETIEIECDASAYSVSIKKIA